MKIDKSSDKFKVNRDCVVSGGIRVIEAFVCFNKDSIIFVQL